MFSQENYSIMKQRKNNLLATNIWKTEMAKQSDQICFYGIASKPTLKNRLKLPRLKLVMIMLETWNLVRNTYSTRNLLVLQMSAFFGENNNFTQNNSMRAVLAFLIISIFVR